MAVLELVLSPIVTKLKLPAVEGTNLIPAPSPVETGVPVGTVAMFNRSPAVTETVLVLSLHLPGALPSIWQVKVVVAVFFIRVKFHAVPAPGAVVEATNLSRVPDSGMTARISVADAPTLKLNGLMATYLWRELERVPVSVVKKVSFAVVGEKSLATVTCPA